MSKSETTSKELTLKEILAADDTVIKRVDTPEWGGHIFVRNVSGDRRDELDQHFSRDEKGERSLVGMRAYTVGKSMCTKDGAFLDPSDAELKALGKKSTAPLDRAMDVCQRLSHMRAEDVEELEKNWQTADESDSG